MLYNYSVKGIPAVFLGSAQDEKVQSIEGILKYVNELLCDVNQ